MSAVYHYRVTGFDAHGLLVGQVDVWAANMEMAVAFAHIDLFGSKSYIVMSLP